MASKSSLKVLEHCRVSPFINSATPRNDLFSLPLTCFDIKWLKFFPLKQIFFYQLGQHESTHTFFNSVILPKLKHSLSLTLSHFLPIAGNTVWPDDAVKPFILYTPKDSVSLVVIESNSDLNRLSQNEMQGAEVLHPYIPELPVSDSKAALIAFQITFFPSQGFSIGMSFQHIIFDGKSLALFMKAWAHICKENSGVTLMLPFNLTPSFDRTVFNYPQEIDMLHLNNSLKSSSDLNPKSLKLLGGRTNFDNLVRANFEFSPQDINRLRQKVVSVLSKDVDTNHMHLSPFVISLAYTLACMIKAKIIERGGKIGIRFGGDGRSRLDPPIPSNYVGNCVVGCNILIDAKDIINNGEAREKSLGVQSQHPQGLDTLPVHLLPPSANEISFLVKKISEKIKGLEIRGMEISIEHEKEEILEIRKIRENSDLFVAVAWSPKFGIYNGTDFGWGKPKKIQVVSIDNNGMISFMETRDGKGGIEVGLVMKRHEMEMFKSLFVNGLKTAILPSLL